MPPTTVMAEPDAFVMECRCQLLIGFPERIGERCKTCHGRILPSQRFPQKAEPPPTGAAPAASSHNLKEECETTVARAQPKPAHVVSRRQRRQFRQRPVEWAPCRETVGEQLAELSPAVERLYIVGPKPAEMYTWATGELPAGWVHDRKGHYLDNRAGKGSRSVGTLPILRYQRTREGEARPLEIHRAAVWFGEGSPEITDCADAWRLISELIESKFDEGQILSTPSATGRYLWMRTIPYGRTWDVLDNDTQALIRSTSGQGRVELFWSGGPLPQLVQYDARWAYAALCGTSLGAGTPTRDTVDEYAGNGVRGRYLVAGNVPDNWVRPGIIGMQDDASGWRWPREPGEPFKAWVDGAELSIALNHGWEPTIHERLLFPRYDGRGPLDTWRDKLVELRAAIEAREAVGSTTAEVAALAKAGVRSVLLQTIGAFQGRGHRVTIATDDDEAVPASARETWRMEGNTHLWNEDTGQAWAEMAHPEFSAAIWSRMRARLLEGPRQNGAHVGMLNVEPAELVGCRTDAIYTTKDPGWPDTGKVGAFRIKRTVNGPLAPPRNTNDLLNPREA